MGSVTIMPDSYKTLHMRLLERSLDDPLEVILTRRLREGATEAEIGEELGVSDSCVSRWIHRLGIVRARNGSNLPR